MTAMLESISSFPTVLFTVLVVVAVIYWLFVIIGALDIHMFDGVEGVAEGATEGATEAVAEGAAEGVHELGDGHDLDHDGLLDFVLGKRRAPLTVIASLFALSGWVISYFLMLYLAPHLSVIVPEWVTGAGVLVVSTIAAMPAASLVSRPLGPLFLTHEADRLQDLIGRTCIIETGSVDAKFGQGLVIDGGAGHKIQVRCDQGPDLHRGDEALIIGWDPSREAFRVERMASTQTNEQLAKQRAGQAAGQSQTK